MSLVWVYARECRCPWRPEDGDRLPGTGVVSHLVSVLRAQILCCNRGTCYHVSNPSNIPGLNFKSLLPVGSRVIFPQGIACRNHEHLALYFLPQFSISPWGLQGCLLWSCLGVHPVCLSVLRSRVKRQLGAHTC